MLLRMNIRLDYDDEISLDSWSSPAVEMSAVLPSARTWRIMHRRVHSWLHLWPVRAALMLDVYRVYGADRRDRNFDCLDNVGENAYS